MQLTESENVSDVNFLKGMTLAYTPFTCMTKRWPAMPLPCSASKASVANRTPLPVAASLPNDPPRSCVLSRIHAR
jgi:hypothetical protein